MKQRTFITILGLVVILLAACSTGAPSPLRSEADFIAGAAEEMAPAEPSFERETTAAGADALEKVNLQNQVGQERLIIRSGDMSIVVEDSDAAAADIARLAESLDGWVVSSDLFESGGYKRGSVTVRVPANRFDAALTQIKDLALEVNSESTSSQDVTEEYVDLESRLANLRPRPIACAASWTRPATWKMPWTSIAS